MDLAGLQLPEREHPRDHGEDRQPQVPVHVQHDPEELPQPRGDGAHVTPHG